MRIVKPIFIFDEDTNDARHKYLVEQILYCIVDKGKLEIKLQSIKEGRTNGIPNMEVFEYHFNPLTKRYTGSGWTRMPDGDKRRSVDISDDALTIEFPVTYRPL